MVKKETVKGIIGNTQGVSNANRPPTNPKRNILNKELPDSVTSAVPVSKNAVFFKSSCSFLVSSLLLLLTVATSFSNFSPFSLKEKDSSTCMHACLQTWP